MLSFKHPARCSSNWAFRLWSISSSISEREVHVFRLRHFGVEVEGCAAAAAAAKAAAKKNYEKRLYIALTDYAKLDYKEQQPRMKARRIINGRWRAETEENNLLSPSFTRHANGFLVLSSITRTSKCATCFVFMKFFISLQTVFYSFSISFLFHPGLVQKWSAF